MGLLKKDDRLYTYADYCTWPEDERWELIDGVAYAMAPAPTWRHQTLILEIARQVATTLKGKPCRAFIAPFDVRLPRPGKKAKEVLTVLQPDIGVICDRAKLDDKGCNGAPDWVIEVLSPSTASHDQIIKRRAYEQAGVREFWIVHPTDNLVTVYVLKDGAYGRPDIYELKDTLASVILPEVVIDWAELPQD